MKKSLLALVLAMVMIVGLVGCGGSGGSSESTEGGGTAESTEIYPLQNLNIRMALTSAIDRETITADVLKDGSQASYRAVPKDFCTGPDGKDFSEDQEMHKDVCNFDATKAAEYWQKGLEELGVDGFEIEMIVDDDDAPRKVSTVLKEQWETTLPGLTVNLRTEPKKQRVEDMQDGNFDLALTRWGPDYADPMTYLGMWITDNDNNYGHWTNEEYDGIIQDCTTGETAMDPEARWSKLYDAEAIVLNEAVIFPIYGQCNAEMLSSKVKGIEFHPVALNRVYKNTTKEDGSDLNVMIETGVESLDPQVATDGTSFEFIANYTDGLMQMDADGQPIEALAESYDISEDGTEYTFHLRDAKWSNGADVTAADFVFAWQRAVDPELASEYSYMLSDIGQIKNAAEIINGEKDKSELGVTAVDDKTLKVELNVPVSYFLSLMYFPTFYPMNEEFFNSTGGNYGTSADTVISNGAFVVDDYTVAGNSLHLKKNEDYWNADNVKLSGISYQVIQDSQQALMSYQNGDLDTTLINGDQVDQVADSDEFQAIGAGYLWYISPNIQDFKISK